MQLVWILKAECLLQEFRFRRLLKLQKAKDEYKSEGKDELSSIENITLSEEEYPLYLVMSYRAMLDQKDKRSKSAKAWSRLKGFVKQETPEKGLTNEEIKQQLLADIIISDEDLRLLANARAANVKNNLIEFGKIEAERLFLIEPQIVSNVDSEKEVDLNDIAMQVDLVIK